VGKSPAFRFYPGDFMGSPDVQAMDLEEVGAYLFLLCMAWQSERHGYLEDNDDRLRRLARMNHTQWARSRDLLLRKFPIVEPGWRANARMLFEADKQRSFSESQSTKGKRGGRPRKADDKPELSDEKPELSSDLSPEKPSVSVSVSVSASVLDSVSVSEEKLSTLALTSIEVPAGVFELPLLGNQGEWSVPENLYQEMVKAYPGVSVMAEFANMRGWLITNPTRRKTRSGLPKFINSWLSKAQNNQGSGGGSHGNGKPTRIDMILDSTAGAMEIINRRKEIGAGSFLDSFGPYPRGKPTFAENIAAKQQCLDRRSERRSREQQILDSAQRYEEKINREEAEETERKNHDTN
jgi:uncharacterized protein YdaU (DUF1376 family)